MFEYKNMNEALNMTKAFYEGEAEEPSAFEVMLLGFLSTYRSLCNSIKVDHDYVVGEWRIECTEAGFSVYISKDHSYIEYLIEKGFKIDQDSGNVYL